MTTKKYKIKQILLTAAGLTACLLTMAVVFTPSNTLAAPPKPSTSCSPTDGSCYDCTPNPKTGKAPAGCPGCEDGVCKDQAASPNAKCSKAHGCDIIGKYVNPLINLLSVSFGLIAVASIIFGGIQYSMSAGDPQEVSKAKDRIKKTLFAIVAYFFLYALLQFLVPGGVFNRPT